VIASGRIQFGLCILHCALLASLSGCSAGRDATPVPSRTDAPISRSARQPVLLPDLLNVAAPVRRQLEEGYAALTAKQQTAAVSDRELGSAYGDMGKLLFAAEYWNEAEPALVDAEALAPTDLRWPYYLGHLYRVRADSRRSTAAFERTLNLAPDDVATLVWLATSYLDQGRPADAEPLLNNAHALQPTLVPALFGLGQIALGHKEYSRAVDDFQRALALEPGAVSIHYPLALAYRGMGDLANAEAHLKRRGPSEIRPPDPLMHDLEELLDSPISYEQRGADAIKRAEWAAAAEYFRKAIELAPGEPSLRHRLGTVLAMQGDSRAAFDTFEEVTRRWPKFAKAQYSLGVMLADAGRRQEAIDRFKAALQSDPNFVEAHLQFAEALRATGRFQSSLAEYEATMRLDPRRTEARLGYAMALAGMGGYEAARAQLVEDQRLFPDHPEFADVIARLPPARSSVRR
jgi:tetratricopeptide (TPR) repeat protein